MWQLKKGFKKTSLLKIKLKRAVNAQAQRACTWFSNCDVFSNLIKAQGQFDTLLKGSENRTYMDHLSLEQSIATEYIACGVSFCSERFY